LEQKSKYKAAAMINQQTELRTILALQYGVERSMNNIVIMHNIFILWRLHLKTNFGANAEIRKIKI
jgi:hypothetical protein